MSYLFVTKVIVLCAIVCTSLVIGFSIWEQHKMIKKGWKREDEEPWDDDLE